jgi:hypothetical protein
MISIMSNEETWADKHERLQTGPRLRALDERLVRLESDDLATARRTLRSIHLLLVDATLDGDTFLLDAALDGLQRVNAHRHADGDAPESWRLRGRLETMVEEALLALERVPAIASLASLEPDGQAACFLRAVAEQPGASNAVVREFIGDVSTERVSMLGRELVQRGLARKRKIGRRNSWDLTPRGVQTLQLVNAGGAARPQREHRLPALG